ncbi:MAG: DUF4260 domain-containing protein [Myxococcales bacterium]|nr:DUF4260 domain-containing protein [Myxococcales bacterium]
MTNHNPVTGAPRQLLRIEGLAMLIAGMVAYSTLGGSWVWFAVLFLVPDLSMLGYLANPRTGAWTYNAAHALIGPAILAPFAPTLAAIWLAHVGFDRALGYGLKYSSAFTATHLGIIGRRRVPTTASSPLAVNVPA